MSKSSRTNGFGGRGGGTVTVIDVRMLRASARNAMLAFWVTTVTVTLLAASVLADRMHPIMALFAGLFLGTVTGAVVWALVRAWPVIRLLWWWTPEIALALGVVYGFTALARHTNVYVRLVVLSTLVGVLAGIPVVRRSLKAWALCLIDRHRLRTSFAQFIIANQSGSLPLILLARPTPVGERVWIYLRPGLSLAELQQRTDKLAVACHADYVVAERAGKQTKAGYLRVDIKRREVLDVDVPNPLVDHIDSDADIPARVRNLGPVPSALDLPEVTDPATTKANGSAKPVTPLEKPTPRKPSPTVTPAPVAVSADGEDISDLI